MRLFIFLLLISCSISAYASRKGVAMYLRFGGGYTGMTSFSGTRVGIGGTSNCHFDILLGVGYMFNNHFGIFSGVGSTAAFWRHANYYTSNDYQNYNQQQSFTEIPVTLRCVTSKFIRKGFFADLGFKICIVRSVTNAQNIEFSSANPIGNNNVMTRDNIADFKKITPMAYSYAGLYCPLSGRGTLLMGPELQYQLSNNFNLSGFNGHLLSLGFKVGLNIKVSQTSRRR